VSEGGGRGRGEAVRPEPAPPACRARRGPDGRLDYRPEAGDLVALRAAHVCGADRMVVTRVGLDVRLSCSGCGAHLVLSRQRFRGRVREVLGTVAETGAPEG
jgi:hypothetical protein